MYEVKAIEAKNAMYLRFEGFLSDEEVKKAVSEVMKAADQLKTGFTIINHIKDLSPASKEVAEEIAKAQKYVQQKGCRRSIRIVGNVLSKHQFRKVKESSGAGYEVFEVATLEDAKEFLSKHP